MWPFSNTVAEIGAETDEDKLARAETEAIFAEGSFNAAVVALREHNLAHAQNAFSFRNNYDTTFIVTMTNDAVRKRLERDVREALERRNRAWAARVALLQAMGRIR